MLAADGLLGLFHRSRPLHLGPHPGTDVLDTLTARTEDAIRQRLVIDADPTPADAASIDKKQWSIEEWRRSLFCLRATTDGDPSTGTIIHALVQTVYHQLGGNVHALKAHHTRGKTFVSVYFSLPEGMGLDEAKRVVG